MSETPPTGPGGNENEDLGPPAVELQQLESEPEPGFFRRIRTLIDRRVLTGQLFEQAWTAPLKVFLEFVGAVLGLLAGGKNRPDGPDPQEPER